MIEFIPLVSKAVEVIGRVTVSWGSYQVISYNAQRLERNRPLSTWEKVNDWVQRVSLFTNFLHVVSILAPIGP